jgi:DNA polymerase II small subunit/DNA polymerase delta subunit B
MDNSRHEKVIQQKSALAEKVLKVAEQALGDIEASMGECAVRDLINIFNSSLKAHRDLLNDIVAIQETESKAEKDLAKDKEYTGKVESLLKKLSQGNLSEEE